VTGHASISSAAGVTLSRATGDGLHGDGPDAVKTFVDAKVSIGPSATNAVGQSHTFTVTVLKNVGDGAGFVAADGEHVAFTLTDGNGAAHTAATGTCTGAGANTDANGQCQITFTSPSAGTVTGHASISSAAGVTLSRATGDGLHGDGPDAVKTFVDAYIAIDPLTASPTAGSDQPLTVSVYINDGSGNGYAPTGGVPVTVTPNDSGGASSGGSQTCTTSSAADSTLGTCPVTINSATAGQTTVNASFVNLNVGGVLLSRATNDNVSQDSADASIDWQ
jgi:hypothetical protein